MNSRLLSAVGGIAVLILSASWPQVLQAPEIASVGAIGGFLSFLGIMLGVYLMFYAMTGEWLPKLSRHNRQP
jgi:hypothetical protein